MTKIDLEINDRIPSEIRNIILRAETDIHARAIFANEPGRLAQIVSQMIQQAYFIGCLDGDKRTHNLYTEQLKNLGKAVQS